MLISGFSNKIWTLSVSHCPGLTRSINGGSSEIHSFYCILSFCFQHHLFLLPKRPERISSCLSLGPGAGRLGSQNPWGLS